jgi:electron transfer flavoprotein alpha/beta subunit
MLSCLAASSLLYSIFQHLIHAQQRCAQERVGAGVVEGAIERAVEAAFRLRAGMRGPGVHAVNAGQPDAEFVA